MELLRVWDEITHAGKAICKHSEKAAIYNPRRKLPPNMETWILLIP